MYTLFMTKKMSRTQLYFPTEMLDWLKQEAFDQNTSIADITRKAVAFFKKHQ